jgi:hypothetical protein
LRPDEDRLWTADRQTVSGSGSAICDAERAIDACAPQEPAEDLCFSFGRDDLDGNQCIHDASQASSNQPCTANPGIARVCAPAGDRSRPQAGRFGRREMPVWDAR